MRLLRLPEPKLPVQLIGLAIRPQAHVRRLRRILPQPLHDLRHDRFREPFAPVGGEDADVVDGEEAAAVAGDATHLSFISLVADAFAIS